MKTLRLLGLLLILALAPLPLRAQAAGTVTVTCAAGAARLEVDGKPAGRTPATLNLAPGPHRLRATRDGFPAFEQELVVEAGLQYAVEATFPRPEGVGHILYVDAQGLERVRRAWLACAARDPRLKGSAVLSPPSRGWVGLATQALENLPPEAAAEASRVLSRELDAGVLHLVVSPDGRAWYFYARSGQILDRYCSNPGTPEEVGHEALRSWAGRPEALLPLCRGRALSASRPEVSLTDLNGVLYFYYPEMRQTRPAAWRTPAEIMRLLAQVLGTPQPPAPFAALVVLPGWKRF